MVVSFKCDFCGKRTAVRRRDRTVLVESEYVLDHEEQIIITPVFCIPRKGDLIC
jgi:hypothetical protein